MVRRKPVALPSVREVKRFSVDDLLLDSDNPRLASMPNANTQDGLLKLLWEEMAVDEVALSIAANGFFPEEQLFVVPAAGKTGKYVVVEGNRRLAAVILLRSKEKRVLVGATDLPELSAAARKALDAIPVSPYNTREELWQYFGFRHINGAQPWDPFSKAKYVAQVHELYGKSLDEIADSIGDTHATVKRLYRGYKLLEQAELQAGFDKEDRIRNKFHFSHLYTAADQPEFQRFLGIESESSLRTNPVPRRKLSELKELMVWLYGSRSSAKEPIVRTQNPDLGRLRDIIKKPNALSALRTGMSLDQSFDIGVGDKRRFRDALTRAKAELQLARGTVLTGDTGDADLLETAVAICEYAESIKAEMSKRREK